MISGWGGSGRPSRFFVLWHPVAMSLLLQPPAGTRR